MMSTKQEAKNQSDRDNVFMSFCGKQRQNPNTNAR